MSVALVARVIDTQANQSFDATFERFPIRIGRNQLNDLHIDRPFVSQFHAAVDVRDGQIQLRDLGSTNGTVYGGQRLARDTTIDITGAPEVHIGPVVIRFGLVSAAPKKQPTAREGTMLDFGEGGVSAAALSQRKPIAPGAEDPYIRQLVPYVEAYRGAWVAVYRVVYDHLTRLPPDVRTSYIKRLGVEHPQVNSEPDFQKVAKYYGVDTNQLGELAPPQAALAALAELATTLAPGTKPPDDVAGVLNFARRMRDSMEVFLKCFISLRDGYKAFEAEMLARDRGAQTDQVAAAKDSGELGRILLAPPPNADTARQLHDIFVDVMSHQVALLNGVMEGIRSLLKTLSPRAIEAELERKGKKGLFSSRYEELWKLYEERHGDYSGEDKQIVSVIFGPQFERAYAAAAGEDYQGADPAAKAPRYPMAPPPGRPR
jgi:type VI secretion system protein ImpI